MTIQLEQRSVLAGAYLRAETCLDHYIVVTPFKDGRLRREQGEPLCKRVDPDNVCDIGTAGATVCPICLEMAHRLRDRGHEILIAL